MTAATSGPRMAHTSSIVFDGGNHTRQWRTQRRDLRCSVVDRTLHRGIATGTRVSWSIIAHRALECGDRPRLTSKEAR